jgi:glutamate racemase
MLAEQVDTIVLGCTHYPFVIPLVQDIAGPSVRVIDPAPAVARQVGRLLPANQLTRSSGSQKGKLQILTSGDPQHLETLLPRLLGENAPVQHIGWDSGKLKL